MDGKIRGRRRKIRKNMEEGNNDERAKNLQRMTVENIEEGQTMKELGKEYRNWKK